MYSTKVDVAPQNNGSISRLDRLYLAKVADQAERYRGRVTSTLWPHTRAYIMQMSSLP